MYNSRPGLVLGFHGTDQSIVDKVAAGKEGLKPSINKWDWLGYGIYFWEHSQERALEFAKNAKLVNPKSKIQNPAVIGAVIDLSHCLDLLDYNNFSFLREAYKTVLGTHSKAGIPTNKSAPNSNPDDFIYRALDCAVLEAVHDINREGGMRHFDSVRSVFWEGDHVYPEAGFKDKNHIQICIRNPNCIKGYFVPRQEVGFNGKVEKSLH
jgi:hypothetical protein